jgi:DNA repair exonuclease SbcCD ATPase subunit
MESLRTRIKALREKEDQLNVLRGSVHAAEKQLEDFRGKLSEQQKLQESQGGMEVWFEKCGKALTWFKKDGLPRQIHRSVLDQLVSTINRELGCFESPFTVTTNEDLTFTATFPNGTRSMAKDLSGGQKVMLAMAFWSAINRTFAQNLGMMILDEPTDGLDRDNKEYLCRIMEEWSKLLRHRGQQVIIITHDIEMENSFDSVIKLQCQTDE